MDWTGSTVLTGHLGKSSLEYPFVAINSFFAWTYLTLRCCLQNKSIL
jgi:hypothetical protein